MMRSLGRYTSELLGAALYTALHCKPQQCIESVFCLVDMHMTQFLIENSIKSIINKLYNMCTIIAKIQYMMTLIICNCLTMSELLTSEVTLLDSEKRVSCCGNH